MFHVVHQPTVEVSQPFGEPLAPALTQAFLDAGPEDWGALLLAVVKPWEASFVAQACDDGRALPSVALQQAMTEAWQRGLEVIGERTADQRPADYLQQVAQRIELLSNGYARAVHENIPGGVNAGILDRQRKLTLLIAGRLRGLTSS